jgi:hypothetical protein
MYISIQLTRSIIRPIEQILKVINKFQDEDLDFDVMKFYAPGSLETNELYESIKSIKQILRFHSDRYFVVDDPTSIMNYAAAKKFFESTKNYAGVKICAAKMGEIFFRQDQLEDAMTSFLE